MGVGLSNREVWGGTRIDRGGGRGGHKNRQGGGGAQE